MSEPRANNQAHWENVYSHKKPNEVGWFQPSLVKSMSLIGQLNLAKSAPIIDVGGGASTLADDLLAEGFCQVSVLDIASAAIKSSQQRLCEKAAQVNWLHANVLDYDFSQHSQHHQQFKLWHDRAVFHFLTDAAQQHQYIQQLKRALQPGGFLLMACFSTQGPDTCSGLPVQQYDIDSLSERLGEDFNLVTADSDLHVTPWEAKQHFLYAVFQYQPAA